MTTSPIKMPITYNMWRATFLVATQSFLFGYTFSALNPCLVLGSANSVSGCYDHTDGSCPPGTIYNDFNLSTNQTSLASALLVAGAWMGSLAGSMPADRFGRRWTLFVNALIFILGGIISATGNLNAFFISRVITGFAVGVSSGLCPVLLNELADHDNRGLITTIHQVMLTTGIFLAAVIAYAFVSTTDHGWKYVLGLQTVPAGIVILCFGFLPESPKWLIRENRFDEAIAVLKVLRPSSHDTFAEANEIQKEANESSSQQATWKEVFQSKQGMIIGCGLLLAQALTGINSVIFYSTTIFGFAGFSQAVLATTSVGAVNLIMTIIAASLIDRWGRKILLLSGQYIMMFSLLLLATILIAPAKSTSSQGIVAVIAVLVFIAGFAISLGAVVWAIISEIMPNRLRAKALSLFLSLNWGANLIIALFTLTAIQALGGVNTDTMNDDEIADANKKGVSYLYYIFFGLTVVSIAFTHIFVPETKGMKLVDHNESGLKPLLSDMEKHDDNHSSNSSSGGALFSKSNGPKL